jgi:hypothetical protein
MKGGKLDGQFFAYVICHFMIQTIHNFIPSKRKEEFCLLESKVAHSCSRSFGLFANCRTHRILHHPFTHNPSINSQNALRNLHRIIKR